MNIFFTRKQVYLRNTFKGNTCLFSRFLSSKENFVAALFADRSRLCGRVRGSRFPGVGLSGILCGLQVLRAAAAAVTSVAVMVAACMRACLGFGVASECGCVREAPRPPALACE